jgi:hypothetical protein
LEVVSVDGFVDLDGAADRVEVALVEERKVLVPAMMNFM